MKKFTRIASSLVAVVMSSGVVALAACDNEDDTDSAGGSTSIEATLTNAIATTIEDVYSSTTGYEINASASYSYKDSYEEDTFSATASLKTQNDGTNFNADGEVNITTGYKYEGETHSSTLYGKAYLRGTDLYYNGTDESTEADLPMYYMDLSDIVDEFSAEYGISGIDSYLTAYESGEYDDIISAAETLMPVVLANVNGTVTSTSSGYTLDYDVDGIVLKYINDFSSLVNVILAKAESDTSYTLGEYLADSTVKSVLQGYLGDLTGSDIYSVIDSVAQFIGTSASDLVNAGYITQPTDGQSAYDYIVSVINNITVSDGDESDSLKNLPLNDSSVISALTEVSSVLTQVKTIIETISADITFTFNTGYVLTGVAIDYDMTYDSATIGVDLSVTMESKSVTLYDTTNMAYIAFDCSCWNSFYDETSSSYYYIYYIGVQTYCMSDGTATVIVINEDDYSIVASYTGTYTVDENGYPATITLDGTTYEIGSYGSYTITIDGVEYSAWAY